jgi:hypothetical protein
MNKEQLKREMVVLDDEIRDIETKIESNARTVEIKNRLQIQLNEKADKHWDLYVEYHEL